MRLMVPLTVTYKKLIASFLHTLDCICARTAAQPDFGSGTVEVDSHMAEWAQPLRGKVDMIGWQTNGLWQFEETGVTDIEPVWCFLQIRGILVGQLVMRRTPAASRCASAGPAAVRAVAAHHSTLLWLEMMRIFWPREMKGSRPVWYSRPDRKWQLPFSRRCQRRKLLPFLLLSQRIWLSLPVTRRPFADGFTVEMKVEAE